MFDYEYLLSQKANLLIEWIDWLIEPRAYSVVFSSTLFYVVGEHHPYKMVQGKFVPNLGEALGKDWNGWRK